MIKSANSVLASTDNRLISRYQYWFLAAITLLPFVLRFYKLGEWSFWIDEYVTIKHSHNLTWSSSLLFGRKLSYLFIKLALLFFGESEWTARFIPALIGLISIPLLYWIVKKFFDLPIAIFCATLLAISPWHIYWSQNARFYTQFLLFYNISIFSFYIGLEQDKSIYYIASLLAFFFAFLSHQMAVLLIPFIIGYILLLRILAYKEPKGFRLKYFLYLTLVPFITLILIEMYRVIIIGTTPFVISVYNQFFNNETRTFIGIKNPYSMLTSVIYYLGTPVALLSLFGSFYLLKQKSRIGLLLIFGSFAPMFLFMLLTLFASVGNRYVFMTLPGWIILAAIGAKELCVRVNNKIMMTLWAIGISILLLRDPVMEDVIYFLREEPQSIHLFLFIVFSSLAAVIVFARIWTTNKRITLNYWTIVLLLSVILHPAITDSMYFAYQNGQRGKFKEAVSVILANYKDGDKIVSGNNGELIAYYSGKDVVNFRSLDFGAIFEGNQRIWFIEEFEIDTLLGASFGNWLAKNCILVKSFDQYTAGRAWRMRVYLFDPSNPSAIHHNSPSVSEIDF